MTDKKQHSRNFRAEFAEFLAIVKQDVEDGADFGREFSVDPERDFDPEVTTELKKYFDESGLDYNAPGHWQFLFVGLINHVHLEHPGRKGFTVNEKDQFLREIVKLKIEHPEDKGVAALCERWALRETAAGRYPPTVKTLRWRFQEWMAEVRLLAREGKATPEQKEWINIMTKKKVL